MNDNRISEIMDKYGLSIVELPNGTFEVYKGHELLDEPCETFESALNRVLILLVINLEYQIVQMGKMWLTP